MVSEASYSIVVGWISIKEFRACQDTMYVWCFIHGSACAVHNSMEMYFQIKPADKKGVILPMAAEHDKNIGIACFAHHTMVIQQSMILVMSMWRRYVWSADRGEIDSRTIGID